MPDPTSSDEPLVVCAGDGLQTVDQHTLKATAIHAVDGSPDPRYASTYSNDELDTASFATASGGPVAWDHGSVLLAVGDTGDYRLVRLDPK